MKISNMFKGIIGSILASVLMVSSAFVDKESVAVYRSPEKVVFSPDGKLLAINDLTANVIYILRSNDGVKVNEIKVNGRARDIKWRNNQSVFFSEYETGMVWEVAAKKGSVMKRYNVGPTPTMFTFYNDQLWVSLSGRNQIAGFDLNTGRSVGQISVGQQPLDVELIPKTSLALVANLVPSDPANTERVGTYISVVDLAKKEAVKKIYLPHGSTNLRNIEISPDGQWAYAVHTRGKVNLPTSQLEKGWVISNMLSIINLSDLDLYSSVILDRVSDGAADPWNLAYVKNSGSLLITLAGVHQVAEIDLTKLHSYLSGTAFPEFLKKNDAGASTAFDVWTSIRQKPSGRMILADQISALHAARVIKRYPLEIKAPRGIAVSPDGSSFAIAGYFSGQVALFPSSDFNSVKLVSLGAQPAPDIVRTGEQLFYDGMSCFQTWLSCSSCHPDSRADGLNWDLLNDGIGNPKNAKSMVLTHATPPSMSTGIRKDYTIAVQKGYHFIQFYKADDIQLKAVEAYLASLKPDMSPYHISVASPTEKESLLRGKQIFESERTGCSNCHSGKLATNLGMYDVGTGLPIDRRNDFDTPALVELWRTAPYLHSGATADLSELLTKLNPEDRHGKTSHLKKDEVADLVTYLLSL